ncbi:MAG: oligopeptidase B, partial [Microbacterium sp.]
MTLEDTASSAPVAAARPVVRTHHGDEFEDRYEWLRAKEDAEVIAHLEAENAYTRERTAHLEPLREKIFGEIKGRTLETDLSVPSRRGQWWYYSRTVDGRQYGIQCRAPLASPDDWTPPSLSPDTEVPGEQILLDGNVEAEGHEFFSLGSFEVSNDADRMLYGVDVAGDERYTIRVRDLVTGENLADEIPDTFAGASFSPDGRFIVYTTVDDAWRPDTVWLHEIGTPVDADEKLFHEPDERFWVGAGFTRSDRYLVIGLGSSITSEEWLVDAADLRSAPRVVWPRTEGVEYDSEHAVVDGEDVLYILHNQDALDFELVRVAASDPSGERAVVVAHKPGERLLGLSTFRDWGVLGYRRGGLPRLG